MKRKMAKLAAIALAATAMLAATALSACSKKGGNSGENPPYYDTATVYAQAQDLGYSGTLEEFIELISGEKGEKGENGKDGVSVESGSIDENGHLILTLTDGSEKDCGKIVDVHEHEFCGWTLIAEETCTAAGLEIRGCECGHTESKITPATGHNHGKWAMTNASSHSRTCTVCNETETAPHSYDSDGVCTDCGYASPIAFGLPLAEIDIITKYDYMMNPLLLNKYQFHAGLDFAAEVGDEVFAVADGEVTQILDSAPTRGTTVKISLEQLSGYVIEYQFAYPVEGLTVGSKVSKGDVIGNIEDCFMRDFTTNIHLHFALTVNGTPDDPEEYIDLVTARDKHMHSFGEGEIVKEATCTVDGSIKKECSCGYSYNIIILAAHGESTYEKVSGSEHNVVCSVCSETLKTETHKLVNNECTLCGYVKPEAPLDNLNVVASTDQGIDFAAEVGDNVYATFDGTVEAIDTDASGTTITLAHKNGYKTIYYYVTLSVELETGSEISAGAAFCTVAKAAGIESDEGVHFHYGVEKDGQLIDPLTIFEDLST